MTPHASQTLALAALTLSDTGCFSANRPSASVWAQRELDDPATRWVAAMDTLRVPGMAIAIVGPDGPLFMQGFGFRNVEGTLPVTPETQFYIASATKPFVALATVLLAHEGAVHLNRPVRTYLPAFRLANFTESITITLRDLLAHRRGLQDHPITFGEAFTGRMTEERFYRLLKNVRAVGELDYANLHYTLLGRVIDSVSGHSWKAELQTDIFGPAGMRRTTTSAAPLQAPGNVATPYELVGGRLESTRVKTDRTMHAAGGMLSTATDLARWVQIQLTGGRIDGQQVFPAEVIAEMQEPQIFEADSSPFVPEHKRIGWGLGWELREDRGSRLVYHGGSYEGWIAHMSFMPDIHTGVVILANTGGNVRVVADIIAFDIYDRLRDLEPRNILPAIVAAIASQRRADAANSASHSGSPRALLDDYVGTYHNDDWGTLDIRLEGDELRARIGDLDLPLVWLGPDSFTADQYHKGQVQRSSSGQVRSVLLSELLDEGLVEFTRR